MRICPFSCSATNGRHRSRLGSRQARCLDLDPIAALAQTSTGHRGACSSTLPSSVARSWKGSERETAQQPKRSRRPAREHRTQGTHLPRKRWCRPWHQQRQLHIRFAARQSFKKFQAGVCANLSSLAADIAIVAKGGRHQGRHWLNQVREENSGVQLRRRRAMRPSMFSPSKLLGASASTDLSTLSKVLTFTTAYRAPSITHVTIGTIPHVLHTWKSAVFVPNRYWPDWEGSATDIRNRPEGCDVQTPRCFLQCPQPHARTGIVCPGPGQSRVNRMLPQ